MAADPGTLPTVAATPESIDRFELVGRLGQGAQSYVYLAYDPKLQREVALKAVRLEPNDARRAALLREARAVSRLSHPAIVPVFEALDSAEGPCLVFEYVAGRTLAERIEADGAIAPAQAVALLLPVLDAVAYAHGQRIVHRDLKPSNILLDDAGRARVMDFGIAVRQDRPAEDGGDTQSGMLGTPAYMAPEYAGQSLVSPAMDIFAAGLVLYEMLCGRRAVGFQQGVAAIRFLLRNDVALPDRLPVPIDQGLRAIVDQALARDPQQRQASMAELANSLRGWLEPSRGAPSASEEMARAAALDALLARMPAELVFPTPPVALEAARQALAAPGLSQSAAIEALVRLVLPDVSLTLLLLRLANAAQARALGAAPVSSLSKAIAQIGLPELAQALVAQSALADGAQDGAAARLHALYAHARHAGLLAQELSGLHGVDGEEARIAGMLQSLGRMLLALGLPQEAGPILDSDPPGRQAQELRARRLFSVGLDDLAGALAQAWGLPAILQQGIGTQRANAGEALPSTRGELLHAAAALADALAEAVQTTSESSRSAAIESALVRHGKGLCLSMNEVRKALQRSDPADSHLRGQMAR